MIVYEHTTHLEGHHGETHDGEVYHAERVLTPEETRVEKPDTWNHDPYEGRGGENPSNVAIVVYACDGGIPGCVPLKRASCSIG